MATVKKNKKGSSNEEKLMDKEINKLTLQSVELKESLKSMKKVQKKFERSIRRVKEIQKTLKAKNHTEAQEAQEIPEISVVLEPTIADTRILYHLVGDYTTAKDPNSRRVFNATGYRISENSKEFLILKDSIVVHEVTPTFNTLDGAKKIRKTLIRTGKLVDTGDAYMFTEDVLFKSPSAASSVILGSSGCPFKNWKKSNGMSMNETDQLSLKLK